MRAIIPCGGYGTRMNMAPDESKEMLVDSRGQPIIDYHLTLCDIYKLTPLVITRKEKTDLIQYCAKRNIETLIIEPKGEWPDTILRSKRLWHDDNILLLPDTRFSPTNVITSIKADLHLGCNASIALHTVDDNTKWCCVKDYAITEKPSKQDETDIFAMGIIGFKANYGVKLFNALRKRDKPFKLTNVSFRHLNEFKDVTRTGKLEV